MGTRFTIQVYADSEETVRPAIQAAWTRLHELNAIFSDYEPESELLRLCRQPPGSRVPVSPDLYEILSLSVKLGQITCGAFDVTIGPLKRLWKQSCRDGRLPTAEKLAEAAKHTGLEKIQLHSGRTVSLAIEGMRLDLGGIGKGYTSRDLVQRISAAGFPRVLVAASGDIAVGASPPCEPGWKVGVLTPERVLLLPPHSAISTSGDSQQFFDLEGTRYSHILDPRTGLGLTHGITVSVHGPDPAMTDALATAVSVMGDAASLPRDIQRDYRIWMFPAASEN